MDRFSDILKEGTSFLENIYLPGVAGGLNVMNLGIGNASVIIKLLWDIDRKKAFICVQWVHSYYIKQRDMVQIRIPKNASWTVKKVLKSRDQLLSRLNSHETLQHQLREVQMRDNYSINKMYISLMHSHPKFTWKHLTLHPRIHPRHKFILWLVIQKRHATVERMLTFGITIPPECAFRRQHMETFTHLFFECRETSNIWSHVLQWMDYKRQIMDSELKCNG